jgi:hypothetical protein
MGVRAHLARPSLSTARPLLHTMRRKVRTGRVRIGRTASGTAFCAAPIFGPLSIPVARPVAAIILQLGPGRVGSLRLDAVVCSCSHGHGLDTDATA